MYQTATQTVSESMPVGGIDIWAGPYQLANVSGTWVIASVPDNTILIEVYFGFPQYKTMNFYAMIPFRATDISTWVDRNGRYQQGDVHAGEIKSSFHVSSNGATIVNASFSPLPNLPYFNVTVGLAVRLHIQGLVSKTEGATDTVVLTFAGQSLIQDDMEPYMTHDSQPVWNRPLLVTIQFPQDAFISSETFPSPVSYYVTSEYRSASFPVNFYTLNFLNPSTSLAETVSLSFTHSTAEHEIQQDLFLGGLLLGIGIPTALSGLYESIKERFRGKE